MKILAVMQEPPPRHGASFVGGIIKDSTIINNVFSIDYLRISTTPVFSWGKLESALRLVFLYINIAKKLIKNRYDLVYVTPCATGLPFYKDLLVVVLIKLFNKNIVLHFHNKGLSKNKWAFPFLQRLFFQHTRVILISKLLIYDIDKYVSPSRIYFLPNGIGEKKCKPKRTERDGPVRIMFLSNMIASKGVYILLDACNLLVKNGIDFECHFIGAWYSIKKSDFDAYVHEKKISDVIIHHGAKYGSDKMALLMSSDIFVFPTLDEVFGLVLLEAMSVGLPCISTREGAIPEIISSGVDGLIMSEKTSECLYESLKTLIGNRPLREKLSLNAYKKYNELYTQEFFEKNFVDLIKKINSDFISEMN